jgi:hypothetical protein
MTRSELVADFGDSSRTDTDLDELEAFRIGGEEDLVDESVLGSLEGRRDVALGVRLETLAELFRVGREGSGLADDDVLRARRGKEGGKKEEVSFTNCRRKRKKRTNLARNSFSQPDQPVRIKLLIRPMLQPQRRIPRRLLKLLQLHLPTLLLLIHVRAVVQTPKQASVDRRLVHDDRIFLVVPRVTEDSDDGVLTGGKFAEVEVFHRTGCRERLLRVVEDVGHRVHADLEVGEVDAHRLLAHRRLVGVTRRLEERRGEEDKKVDGAAEERNGCRRSGQRRAERTKRQAGKSVRGTDRREEEKERTHLIMIRERNNARTNPENHTRMNLAMRPSVRIRPSSTLRRRRRVVVRPNGYLRSSTLRHRSRGIEVLRGHTDHDRLFLLRVEVLHDPVIDQVGPLHLRRGTVERSTLLVDFFRIVILLRNRLNVFPTKNESLILDDEEGTTNSSSVGEESKFAFSDVSDDRDFRADVASTTEGLDGADELGGVSVNALPNAVDEDLRSLGHVTRILLQVLHPPLLEEFDDRRRRRPNGDVSEEGKVLDETTGLTFRRLSGTDHPPVGVVKLSRFRDLTVSTDRSVGSTEMGEGRGEGVTVEDLGDTRFRRHGLLLVAPVTRREGVLETVGDRRRLDRRVDVEWFARLDALQVGKKKVSFSSSFSSLSTAGRKKDRKRTF